MKILTLAAAVLVGSLALAGPAEAQHHRGDRDHAGWNNGHHNGWENGRHHGWKRHHRHCRTVWRHHRRVRICR